MTTPLGLRIDVDTFRGTRDGVPHLLDMLARHDITATFFVTLGPDNMGRHLWRLAKPRFALKMLRSRAASLYGWDVLLAGTAWPGRLIGRSLAPVLRAIAEAGHEVGLHAFDHHRWQRTATHSSVAALSREVGLGVEAFAETFGRPPDCSAAAGWICNERTLAAKDTFGFRYNSDCRGRSVFAPLADGRRCAPQVPTTLPTYDELIGRDGITNASYNARLLESIRPGELNVLAVHAEVEGGLCAPLFDAFLHMCSTRGIRPVPLRSLLPPAAAACEEDEIAAAPIAGREGDVCWQRSALKLAADARTALELATDARTACNRSVRERHDSFAESSRLP